MRYHLAQMNIAQFKGAAEDEANKDFFDNLDRINAIADGSPGFVWRLTGYGETANTASNNATDIQIFEDENIITNLSVWESKQALFDFVYRNPEHLAIMRRRHEWFNRMKTYLVLWWIPAGHQPTAEEGKAKLEQLRSIGASAQAFTFKDDFSPPSPEQANQVLT